MIKSDKKNDQASRISLSIKCQDCIHYKQGPAYFEKKCSELGILPKAKACSAFTPNMYILSKVGEETVADLGSLARELKPSQLRILAFVFANMSLLRKHKLKFGQPVYVNLSSPFQDYLDCYFKGYVVGVSKEGDAIYVTSSLKKKSKSGNTLLSILPSSILTKKKFKARAKKLIRRGRAKLPKAETRSLAWKNRPVPPKKEEDLPDYLKYEVPTLDTAPDSWWDSSAPVDDLDWHSNLKRFNKKKNRRRLKDGVGSVTRKGRTKVYSVSGDRKPKKQKKKTSTKRSSGSLKKAAMKGLKINTTN